MKCFATIAVLACVALVRCEPPLPQNSYLPPNQQSTEPSNNYLPPTQSYQSPANNYLPPQRSQASGAAPQNSYAAPGVTSAIFSKQQQGAYPSANQGYPNSGYGAGSNNGYGNGNGNDEENYGPAKYEFKYDVQDYESGNDFGHMESRDGDRTVGRYYVLLPDGRKQVVDYEADQNGYRPTITYEQTGNAYNNGAHGGSAGGRGDGGFSGYDSNAQSKYQGYN
ncbi:pro-resilin [Eupeodes corollae]|uniref:pro-resilin n=1 Tax=Eupeodes corollae TaxID=290404 RepID=UPI002493738D|nr:pro-resilin [Eupeodes corollae]